MFRDTLYLLDLGRIKMNKIEAIDITKIMCTADNNCPYCAEELVKKFIKSYPEFSECIINTYRKESGCEGSFKEKD